MQIDTAGTYTLKYTAEDACGNITEVEREVVAEVITYRTVLYTDGTLIINESSKDQAANEALHGVATNVYDPFDPNGATSLARYEFSSYGNRLWYNEESNIVRIELGSHIAPTTMQWWFYSNSHVKSIDLSLIDTSNITRMSNLFYDCGALTEVNLSSFDTSNVTSMGGMFYGCSKLTSLDLSTFDTSLVTSMVNMFDLDTLLETIYVSDAFTTDSVPSGRQMFGSTRNLVGGAGTTWASSNPNDKTYARIDNPPDAPGYFTLKSA